MLSYITERELLAEIMAEIEAAPDEAEIVRRNRLNITREIRKARGRMNMDALLDAQQEEDVPCEQ